MTYEKYVDEVFIEEHNCLGLDMEEIEELIEDSTWEQRHKWLKKIGYVHLQGDYEASQF